MAENATLEVQESQPRKQRSRLKLLLLALNVLLFVVGIGALAWTKFGPKPPVTSAATQEPAAPEGQKSDAEHEPAAKGHEAPAPSAGGHGSSAAAKPAGGHGSSAAAKPAGGHGGAAAKGHGGGGSDPMLIPLATFIVNLSGDQGQRYLRLATQVEARGELAKIEIEKHLPEVRNRLIFLLSSKTFADIGSTQGKYDLQADITKNINETLDGPFVRKTYFTEFIIQ